MIIGLELMISRLKNYYWNVYVCNMRKLIRKKWCFTLKMMLIWKNIVLWSVTWNSKSIECQNKVGCILMYKILLIMKFLEPNLNPCIATKANLFRFKNLSHLHWRRWNNHKNIFQFSPKAQISNQFHNSYKMAINSLICLITSTVLKRICIY